MKKELHEIEVVTVSKKNTVVSKYELNGAIIKLKQTNDAENTTIEEYNNNSIELTFVSKKDNISISVKYGGEIIKQFKNLDEFINTITKK